MNEVKVLTDWRLEFGCVVGRLMICNAMSSLIIIMIITIIGKRRIEANEGWGIFIKDTVVPSLGV